MRKAIQTTSILSHRPRREVPKYVIIEYFYFRMVGEMFDIFVPHRLESSIQLVPSYCNLNLLEYTHNERK